MASVILFHTEFGLREFERGVADRLRDAGHEVFLPDLYEGQTANSPEDAQALIEALGAEAIAERALNVCADVANNAVLAGLSTGAAVACRVWAKRTQTSGIVLLHGLGPLPAWVRSGLPVQIHLADPDASISEDYAAEWNDRAFRIGLAAELYAYSGVGHLYMDSGSSDYDAAAAELTWERCLEFLGGL